MSDEIHSKKPLQRAYSITEDKNGKEYWNPVGFATPHKDGQGATVKLHSVPVNGEVVLRDLRDQKMQQYDQQQHQQQQAQQEQPDAQVARPLSYEPQ